MLPEKFIDILIFDPIPIRSCQMFRYFLGVAAVLAYSTHAFTKTCVMPHTHGGDDSPGILAAASPCLQNGTIIFEEGINYNVLTPLSFTGLENVRFSFEGNLSLSDNVTYVQTVVNNTKIYPGRWITIKGSNVVFSGSTRQNGGWFRGQ